MQPFLEKYNKIFFIGIGGISMSGLALLLKSYGKEVLGSDINKSEITKKLVKNKIKVFYKNSEKNVHNCDLVVFSGAIKSDNKELIYAKRNNIKVIERSELLNLISQMYQNVIAISGTHGKTTTSAMIAYIFIIAGLNPTIHIGGIYKYIGGNIKLGSNKYFITEACEFRDSFLTLSPNVCVINNIEREHLDYFKSFNNEKISFSKFANSAKDVCFSNISCKNILKNNSKVKFFNDKNGYNIRNLMLNSDRKYSFSLYNKNIFVNNFKVNVFGRHNVDNALASICVALHYKIDSEIIKLALRTFNNVDRRFEQIAMYKSNVVIHDYAHHPTEITASIKTCLEVFNKDVIVIFQPHTFSRTKTLLKQFVSCFNGIKKLFLVKTYSAREKFNYVGSSDYLKEEIEKTIPKFSVFGAYSKNKTIEKLRKLRIENSILLFLGAGDIEQVFQKLCKKKK